MALFSIRLRGCGRKGGSDTKRKWWTVKVKRMREERERENPKFTATKQSKNREKQRAFWVCIRRSEEWEVERVRVTTKKRCKKRKGVEEPKMLKYRESRRIRIIEFTERNYIQTHSDPSPDLRPTSYKYLIILLSMSFRWIFCKPESNAFIFLSEEKKPWFNIFKIVFFYLFIEIV